MKKVCLKFNPALIIHIQSVSAYTHKYIHTYICMYIYIYIYVRTLAYVCVEQRAYRKSIMHTLVTRVLAYARMQIRIYPYRHIGIHIPAHTRVYR